MSESTAREARRDLRRTVGASALETLRGQEQSIASVAASVNSLRNDVITLARDHAIHGQALTAVAREALCAFQVTTKYGFWRRLRWLVTGV